MNRKSESVTNVFLIEVDRTFWFDVWKKLLKEMDLNVQFLTTSEDLVESAAKMFPEASILSSKKCMRGIYPEDHEDLEIPALDAETLELYSDSHFHTIQMMDCMDLDGHVGFSERLTIYKRQLKYWLGMIEELKPDILFFPTAPHEVYDYVIYQICKKKGIKTFFFEYTSVGTLFVRDDLSDCGHIGRCYSKLLQTDSINSELTESLSREYKKLKKEYSDGKPYFMKKYFK